MCDSIYKLRSIYGIHFFDYQNIPLFNNDHLGDYFVPKLLFRGFETLHLDLSEICLGK